jgi:hypothetical protein
VAGGRWHDCQFYETIPPKDVDASASNPLMLQDAMSQYCLLPPTGFWFKSPIKVLFPFENIVRTSPADMGRSHLTVLEKHLTIIWRFAAVSFQSREHSGL